MPTTLTFRRGTTSQNNSFTGAVGELTIDTDKKTLRVHDNSTAGGSEIVSVAATQTLTNKTLTTPIISSISNSGTLTLPTSTDTLVGRATTDTLTNKTLTTPVISSISNTGTLTLPTSTDTLVGRATTDTLTNKTLTSAVLNTGVSGTAVLDEDNMASNSATKLATQQSIKAYVDTAISSLSSTTIQEGNTTLVVADAGSGTITATVDGATVATFQAGDLALPNNVGLLFGTGGEKIESNGTDLTVTSTGALNLTVTGTTTVSGALTVTGNLTVNGTTTTVNSTNTTIDDNLLELNSGAASNSNDCGIIIERGSTGNNAIFMWDESADTFALGTTTATASTTGDITIATGTLVANLTGTATTATNVTATANNTTNETVYLTFVDGATGAQGIETDTNLTYNPSTNVLTTTASAARYSDIAERYEADEELGFGTVVTIGGSKEITAVDAELSDTVFGVISKQPAYMMNSDAGSDETHPFVAVAGRTPVKVIGAITKGQRIVSSSTRGVARAVTESDTINPFHVLGRALESKTDEAIGMVNCVVRINN